ncbi:MAG: hypothetical protein ACW98Y_11175, partial [Candidatus Thorarchaeota archaeon]
MSWYSAEYPDPIELIENNSIVSDQITILGEFLFEQNDPDGNIISTTLQCGFGVFHQGIGPLVLLFRSYDNWGPIDTSEFAWERVSGIVYGDEVSIETNFTNTDCDVLVFWADTDNTTWSYGNNLIDDQMATETKPEVGSFIAQRNGDIMVGIFDHSNETGEYSLAVDTRTWSGVSENGTTAESVLPDSDGSRPATFILRGELLNGSTTETT